MKTSLIRTRNLVSVFVIFAILVSFASCQSKKSPDSSSTSESTNEKTESKDAVIKEISEYPLPTSFEVTTLLVDAGASYILDLSNHVGNADKYITLKSKALNLGVYGADLSYAATYRQTQETMQYLRVSADLIDQLQIGSFDEDLVREVEENIDDVDALITLISDSFYKTYEYLNNNEQDELSILVMAGSWIEAFYITTQISIISADNAKINAVIAEQKTSLTKLLEVMLPVSESDMSAEVFNGLLVLQKIYEESGENLSEESIEALIKQTENIRNQITA